MNRWLCTLARLALPSVLSVSNAACAARDVSIVVSPDAHVLVLGDGGVDAHHCEPPHDVGLTDQSCPADAGR